MEKCAIVMTFIALIFLVMPISVKGAEIKSDLETVPEKNCIIVKVLDENNLDITFNYTFRNVPIEVYKVHSEIITSQNFSSKIAESIAEIFNGTVIKYSIDSYEDNRTIIARFLVESKNKNKIVINEIPDWATEYLPLRFDALEIELRSGLYYSYIDVEPTSYSEKFKSLVYKPFSWNEKIEINYTKEIVSVKFGSKTWQHRIPEIKTKDAQSENKIKMHYIDVFGLNSYSRYLIPEYKMYIGNEYVRDTGYTAREIAEMYKPKFYYGSSVGPTLEVYKWAPDYVYYRVLYGYDPYINDYTYLIIYYGYWFKQCCTLKDHFNDYEPIFVWIKRIGEKPYRIAYDRWQIWHIHFHQVHKTYWDVEEGHYEFEDIENVYTQHSSYYPQGKLEYGCKFCFDNPKELDIRCMKDIQFENLRPKIRIPNCYHTYDWMWYEFGTLGEIPDDAWELKELTDEVLAEWYKGPREDVNLGCTPSDTCIFTHDISDPYHNMFWEDPGGCHPKYPQIYVEIEDVQVNSDDLIVRLQASYGYERPIYKIRGLWSDRFELIDPLGNMYTASSVQEITRGIYNVVFDISEIKSPKLELKVCDNIGTCTKRDIHVHHLPILKALTWLRSQQNPDGSWTYSGRVTEENVGLTAMATAAFLNHGIDENDPTVRKAIDWILSKQQADGKITNGWYHTYDTSLAVLALVATGNESYYDEIKKAVDFLIELQNDEGEGYTQDDPYYGGWPYSKGMDDWADLSNTQFVLLALYYAEDFNKTDKIVPDEVWRKAEIFVTRCQNREASNPDYNFYDDGGFIYQPGSTIWADGRSYASMTAAGLWGLYTCGVSKNDGRVKDAWKWIEDNYHIDQNYPIGNMFLYYYLYSLAKAAKLWGVNEINSHDWYQEMVDFLVEKQEDDGHWEGTDPDEEPDLVATCWALLALETKTTGKKADLEIRADSPVDLHVYDESGRHVGINYETGDVEIQIPGATYTGRTEPQIITIPNAEAGTYRIVLVPFESGSYTLTVRALSDGEVVSEDRFTGEARTGETYETDLALSAIAGPITVDVRYPEIIIDNTVQTATGRGNATFMPDKGEIEGLTAISDLPSQGKPSLQFPFGFFSFNITGLNPGEKVNITIALPDNVPANTEYWKYGATPDNPTPHWYKIPVLSNDGDNIIVIQLQDDGVGDGDLTANGVITDPGGPGIPVKQPVKHAKVPVLSPYGLIAMATGLIIVAARSLRRN